MALDSLIRKKAEYWAQAPVFDEATRLQIDVLLKQGKETELVERFYKDLEFGTAGMRGVVGPGSAFMNAYNVRRAAFALAQYLKTLGSTRPVGLTYDSRNHSYLFARTASEVLAASGIHVLLTERLQPVPLLSFLIRWKKCAAGIAITASHNPPEYNGCKIYWDTGGQIVPPHDLNILKYYDAIEDYATIPTLDFEKALQSKKIEFVGKELEDAYLGELKKLKLSDQSFSSFKVIFTPLHGAAGDIIPQALRAFGLKNVSVVKEQVQPNGNFPTVKYPNPEEKEALTLAVAQAEKEKAHLVLATDPDGDRIGIATKEGDTFRYLNGNEIVCLVTEYVLSQHLEKGSLPKLPLVIKSITTSTLVNQIAESYGAFVEETLTGFKWICQVGEDYVTGIRTPKREFLCGGEESFGVLVGRFVRDKDGVGACSVAAEMAAHYHAQGKTLGQVLESIHHKHGLYVDSIETLTLPGKQGAEKIAAMTENLRSHPPVYLAGHEVMRIRDFSRKQELTQKQGAFTVTAALDLPQSNVLQFFLKDGTRVSVRPSGTEPKIKFYFSVREAYGAGAKERAIQKLHALKTAIMN